MGNKVFLFEYATCSRNSTLEPSTAVEGIGMFKALMHGFESSCKVLTFTDNIDELLSLSDYSLIIAPETEGALYNLIKKVEHSHSANLGSGSKAVKKTSDKYETYKRIKKFSPRTEVFNGSTGMDFPLVAKPRCGVSGEGIFLLRSEEDLKKIPRGYLLQEYIDGMAMSASLLVGNDTKILSINTQEMENFRYTGAKLPVENFNAGDIIECVSRIKGLFGYVGVDFVYNGEARIIEINARPTTPIIALKDAFNINIAELILKNYYSEKIPDLEVKKRMHLKKVNRSCESFVTFKKYSIVLETINENIDL